MAFLLDTSVLVRLANRADPAHAVADAAVVKLLTRNEVVCIAPQNLIEFRNVATRPRLANGLGLTGTEAESKAADFEAAFSLLAESADIFPAWKALVNSQGVIGKRVHDARLVAICQVNTISNVLTFNTNVALATGVPGLTIVDPANV